MPITVFLDNNMWDFLLKENVDLSKELPADEFSLCITREGEIEMLPPMPDEKREFANGVIVERSISVDSYFGFAEASFVGDARVEGFNQGRFASLEEIAFSDDQKRRIKKNDRPRQRLDKNEGDVALGARSMHWVVLTNENPATSGPLKTAKERGGKVIFLRELLASGMSWTDYIRKEISGSSL